MTTFPCPPALLANDGLAYAIQSYFRRSASLKSVALLLVVAALVAALWWVVSAVEGLRTRASLAAPKSLFDELAVAHQLRASDRELLQRLAVRSGLSDPARVFVRPDVFVADEKDGSAARIAALRQRLFAS